SHVEDVQRGCAVAVAVGIDPEEVTHVDPEAGLLEELAAQRLGRLLTGLDEPARRVPHPEPGLDPTPRQKDPPVALDDDAHRRRGVLVEDKPAGGAVKALGILAGDRAVPKSRGAARADAPVPHAASRSTASD